MSTENGIPVVNPRLNDPTTTIRVIPNAPYEHPGKTDKKYYDNVYSYYHNYNNNYYYYDNINMRWNWCS